MALAKARLVEITAYAPSGQQSDPVPESQSGKQVTVHFNPQSLKLSAANNNQGGSQPGGGSGRQYAGPGSSNLQVELLFDTTAQRGGDAANSDVRKITERLAFFVIAKPQRNDRQNRRAPPLARFEWGSFIFEGVVDSLDETLDYFSEEGVPLRATVALKMSRDSIAFVFGKVKTGSGAEAGGAGAGQEPLAEARADEDVSSLASRNGQSGDWKPIAAANNIDDPLRLPAGTLVNLNAGAAAGAAASFGASASASAGLSAAAGIGAAAQAGFSAGLGGGVGFAAGAGASAGIGAAAGASAGIGAAAGVSGGFGVSASAAAGASSGFGAAAGASGGFGAAAGASGEASSSVGVQAGVGVKFP